MMLHDWYGNGYAWLWVIPAMAFMIGVFCAVVVVLGRPRRPEDVSKTSRGSTARVEEVPAERLAAGAIENAAGEEREEELRLTHR